MFFMLLLLYSNLHFNLIYRVIISYRFFLTRYDFFFLLRFNILFSISYHKFSFCKIVLKNRKRKINSKKNVESYYYVIRMFIRCLIYFFHFRTDINNFFIFIFILVYTVQISIFYMLSFNVNLVYLLIHLSIFEYFYGFFLFLF